MEQGLPSLPFALNSSLHHRENTQYRAGVLSLGPRCPGHMHWPSIVLGWPVGIHGETTWRVKS